jgi:hypothetical protein
LTISGCLLETAELYSLFIHHCWQRWAATLLGTPHLAKGVTIL